MLFPLSRQKNLMIKPLEPYLGNDLLRNIHPKIPEFDRSGVIPNVEQRFRQTLELMELKPIEEINGIHFPSLAEWIAFYKEKHNGHCPYNYQYFVEDPKGRIFFAKTAISTRTDDAFRNMQHEAEILKALPESSLAPKFVGYQPADIQTGTLETLTAEAVSLKTGSTLPLPLWEPEHAREAAKCVRSLESVPAQTTLNTNHNPEVSFEATFQNASEYLTASLKKRIQEIMLAASQRQNAMVHGDTWLKNIVVGYQQANPTVRLVDWERAGVGYLGQDAGRTFWELWGKDELREPFVEDYCDSHLGDEVRNRKELLQFGVAFEAIRWIEGQHLQLIKLEPKSNESLKCHTAINSIQQKLLDVFNFVDNVHVH